MRDILLTLIIFGSVPVILVKPHIGILMWSWIGYMSPHRLTWTFAYDFRFALIIGAATIFAWLISREPKRIPWNNVTMLLVALTIWISFTTIFALYPDQAYGKWDRTIKILVMNGFITLALMGSWERLNALIWVIVLSIGFYGFKGGIFTLSTGGYWRVSGSAGSFFQDNNSLALALLMVIPLIRYLQLTTPVRWIKWGLLILMLLCTISVLGTQSRGGVVGLAVLLVVFAIKSRGRIFIGLALGLGLVAAVEFMPQTWHARMETIANYEEDASVQGRLQAWEYGLDVAAQHPFVGGGFHVYRGNKSAPRSIGKSAHSIYFEVLGEHGFVGLAIFLLLGVATFRMGSTVIRRTKGNHDLAWAQDLARMTQVSLVAFAAAGLFLNLAFFDLTYHLVAIMVLVRTLVDQTLSKSVAVEKSGQAAFSPHDGYRPIGVPNSEVDKR